MRARRVRGRSLFGVAELAHSRGDDEEARALYTEAATATREDSPWAVPMGIELGLTELAEGLLARKSPAPYWLRRTAS